MSPPFHLTADDVNMEMDSSIAPHRDPSLVTGFSEEFLVWGTCSISPAGTNWKILSGKTEQGLEQYSNVVESYWAREPKQVGGENARYRACRVQMAKRSQARSAGEV